MIPRQEVEFTLAMAQKGIRSETPPEVMAELCRVYLAWADAPEADITVDNYVCVYGDRMNEIMAMDGKKVRLVEVLDE